MGTSIENIWLIAMLSKYNHLSTANMAYSLLLLATLWIAIALLYWTHPGGPAWGKHRLTHMSRWPKKSIPGPQGWPIIGSMGLMTGLAHRKIATAAELLRSKRLMAFSLGETRAIVTCHPDVAKEMLNSPDFADRPVKESAYGLMFNRAIGFAPYGIYWRTLRRVASTHMFCPKQIKASEAQRKQIASEMVGLLGAQKGAVQVRDVLRTASLSNMMGSVFGRRYNLKGDDQVNTEIVDLKEMVDQGYELLGVLNWADHLSWLSDFDLQKVRFRCDQLVPKVNNFVAIIIAKHRANQKVHSNRDFVDVLLSLQGSNKLSDSDMIAVLWEMIFRGTDTVAVLIEWALTRLVIHPDVQKRVHDELDKVIGKSRAVTENDVASLVYLTAVIKEVLRLHPPGPLLSWSRLAIQDTTVDGHHVPAGTTAMVDMWAISRDPDVWADPERFDPARFMATGAQSEFSVLGSDLRLAPFGSGRRSCPGKALGLATVSFWVASLLHEFEWMESSNAMVDLSEVLKLSCEMAHPLTVEVRRRRP